jgi:hypothetical protein
MGVVCAFIYDIKLNLLGTIYAILGVLVTSFYQVVLLNFKEKTLKFIDESISVG